MNGMKSSEQIRHESEVREVSTWSRLRIVAFLQAVKEKRSSEAYQKLRDDLSKIVGTL